MHGFSKMFEGTDFRLISILSTHTQKASTLYTRISTHTRCIHFPKRSGFASQIESQKIFQHKSRDCNEGLVERTEIELRHA